MLTKVVYIFIRKTEKPISFQSKEVGFSVAEFSCMCQCLATSWVVCSESKILFSIGKLPKGK